MSTRLFVGSLAWGTTEDALREAFAAVAEVESASIIQDRETGRSRGFGFVDVASEADAQKAIDALNGKELDGRSITVNIAKPREDR